MEASAEETTREKYDEAKTADDLEAMFKLVDNGKELYSARSKCNGMGNFIKQKIPRIKHLIGDKKFNWFSVQQINRAEAREGDEEECCVQIALQPNSSSRKTKVNPIQTLFAEMGLCKNSGRTQLILCNHPLSLKYMGRDAPYSEHACFSFGGRPKHYVFDNKDRGAQTLLATANLTKLQRYP